jgi:cellulose synthase/poly-beta-1,6-N-acetylglucosamine synthase-like glycosyltransferase
MFVSVIVPTYKDVQALELILDALKLQTYKNFEVIVAEDDDAQETKAFLQKYTILNIIHVYHEDVANRKTVIQNKAVVKARGEYLIFIDGDVIPYKNFIKNQLEIAAKKVVLSGRRVNLNSKISKMLRLGEIKAITIEKYYWLFSLYFMFDRNVRYEQGFSINPTGWIYKKFVKNRVRNTEIIGCNFSCYKDDFVAINGFDESYGESRIGDDIDLTWRFKAAGYKLVSSKNIANVFHLYHKKISVQKDWTEERTMLKNNKEKNLFLCKDGLNKYMQ